MNWVLARVHWFWGDLLAILESCDTWVSLPLPSCTQERAAELAGVGGQAVRGCGQTRSWRRQSLSTLPYAPSVLLFFFFSLLIQPAWEGARAQVCQGLSRR